MSENPKPSSLVAEGGHHEEGFVMLPYNKEQFRDFIQSLLGSPQTIGRIIRGTFEVNMDDLRNLHQLIMQRVNQQNDGMLIQFKAKVLYSDESSVELSSADELITYNEIRPVVSVAVHLDWTFLVKFQDKEKREKQRIQISIMASESSPIEFDTAEFTNHRVLIAAGANGVFSIRIEHTARTWGSDIEAMLSNHIQTLCRNTSPTKKFISSHSGKVAFLVGAALFISICFGLYFSIEAAAAKNLSELNAITQAPESMSRVNASIDFIAKFVASGVLTKQELFQFIVITVGLVVSILIAVWIETTANTRQASFLLLTKESLKNREEVKRREKRAWISFLLSIVTAIVTGIFSNILFERYFK